MSLRFHDPWIPDGCPARAFTLFEMMAAIAVLALVFTAVTVSLRGKWRAEEARRGAQRLALAWVKARSYAWREGREWVVVWDKERGVVRGSPATIREEAGSNEESAKDSASEQGFSFDLGKGVQVLEEQAEGENPPVRFFANGRVTPASVVVAAPGKPRWHVWMDWDGKPFLEPAGAREEPVGRAPSQRPILEKPAVPTAPTAP